jgi:hypothetical protein
MAGGGSSQAAFEPRVGAPAFVGHDEDLDASILDRRPALDQAELLEVVDHAGEGTDLAGMERRHRRAARRPPLAVRRYRKVS